MLCPASPPPPPTAARGAGTGTCEWAASHYLLRAGAYSENNLKEIHHLHVNILLPQDMPFCASVKAQLLQTLPSASEPFPFCCWKKKGFLREWQQFFHSCFPCQGCSDKYRPCIATVVTALSFCSSVLLFSSRAHHILLITFKQLLRYTTHVIFSPRVLMALQVN